MGGALVATGEGEGAATGVLGVFGFVPCHTFSTLGKFGPSAGTTFSSTGLFRTRATTRTMFEIWNV
eukprot:CAMPEP_0114559178 /NCGR_PEP_ID=MMETSP0114-20121206/10784_1 /TAXON_ID=31324 /ORGANISM="Goniomonas sp, Strain m" /LENGTH=65 /DNA_ID=CAMNT_0001744633 /DNA_START=251 /DNA_END=448 /DNA_ORIENTATION=-